MIARLLISAAVLAVALAAVIGGSAGASSRQFISAGLGMGLALAAILLGYSMNRWAFGKSPRVFMAVLVGGMLGRLVLIALILVWVARSQHIPLLTFFVSLSISYITFQSMEALTIHRGLKRGKI
ncbi:MAG: hypothetical protein ONB23_08090 [candidate division KSB1 bacterium]|nr:hypothetical protein [candidate division KSB1 bacterium]